MKLLNLKNKFCFIVTLVLFFGSKAYAALNVDQVIEKTKSIDVLLLSDHTLPGHLNLSSGGANGIERTFIDPSIIVAKEYMEAYGLSVHVLNVEDMLPEGEIIETKEQFDLSYANYDKVLKAAVENSVTIISLHFDADIIMSKDHQDVTTYIGGVQIILDKRNISEATYKLSYYMLHDYKILESLNKAGFRTRPDYADQIRYQNNLSLNITGGSPGGSFLLELAAQDQAIRLYKNAQNTAEALRPSLELLAKGIEGFRRQTGLKLSHRLEERMPEDFVVINNILTNTVFDIRYFGENNFVGSPVNGYVEPLCILQKNAAIGLAKASLVAQQRGYRFKIFDCYRPQRAVSHFVKWATDLEDLKTKKAYYPNLPKDTLLGPYIAAKSGHSRGSTVDLTLQRQTEGGDWVTLDMGTPFDFFDRLSNTFNEDIALDILENRKTLIGFMDAGGFVNYDMEWWHFSLPKQIYTDTYFDFPVMQNNDGALDNH